jgi:hypothetical protein
MEHSLYSFHNLWRQYRRCRRNKRNTLNQLRFELEAMPELIVADRLCC